MLEPTIFHAFQPPPPLYPHLQVMWAMNRSAAPHPQERLLPSATTEIIFNLDEPSSLIHNPLQDKKLQPYHCDIVSGPQSGWFTIGTHTPRRLIGLHFQAGGLAPFINMPLGELRGRHIAVEEVWGGEGRRLGDLLRAQHHVGTQFAIIESWLKKRYKHQTRPAVSIACSLLNTLDPERRISALADQLGFSRRHFNRLFQQTVGMPAKTYSRVSRFQATVHYLETIETPDWSDLAAAHGFYDQAHLINEFQAFCGFSPATYLTRRGEQLNHLPLWD